LQTFLESEASHAVIFEDDAVLDARFLQFVRAAVRLPIPWHAINLENRNKRHLRPAIARFDFGVNLHASSTLSSGAAAWLYSREGAALALRSMASFRHAIDTHLGFFWRHKMTALCVYPPLVTQDVSALSTHPNMRRTVLEKELSFPQLIRWRKERIEHTIRKRIAAWIILFRMLLLIRRQRAITA
jgi:GR25 family glycosyltransferase involved in LPS biosynthesis